MKIKKILAACMAITIVGGAMTAAPQLTRDYSITASAVVDDDGNEYEEGTYESLKYRKYSDHVEIAGCDYESRGEIVIPDEIEGLLVTSIGDAAFYTCTYLESVKIPDSVTSIGNAAFLSSGLKSITIPSGVTVLKGQVFSYCTKLTSITIPDSVTTIESFAFEYCHGLKSVIISDSVTSIEDRAFLECTSLESITIPDSVKSIGQYAFAACMSLGSVTILNPECDIFDMEDTFSNGVGVFDGTIYGYENSTAQTYAEKYGYKFESLGAAPDLPDIMLGDINGDGVIDATDASNILALYAKLSTSNGTPTAEELSTCDVDKNGGIDAADASAVLAYYAYVSTENGSLSFEEFMNK